MPPKPDNTSMASNTPRRFHQSPHSWHIHGILYLIDGHFWLKSSLYYLLHNIQQHVILNTYYLILNFMSSLIEIYDHFQREAQIHLWTFMASFMIIFDPKKAQSAKHLWLIDDHFWQKSHESPESIQNTLLKHSGNSWPYIQLIKLSNTRLLKLRNNATCCTRNNQFQHT